MFESQLSIKSYSEKELLQLVKKGDNFLLDSSMLERHDMYKKNLGAVPIYSLFKKKIKSVYVIYETFDGTIIYYEYPQ